MLRITTIMGRHKMTDNVYCSWCANFYIDDKLPYPEKFKCKEGLKTAPKLIECPKFKEKKGRVI